MADQGTHTMTVDTDSGRAKEIGINKPMKIDGNRKRFKNFIYECLFYLTVNEEVYDTDAKRISFILSFMTDKEELLWK
jgi:hypothetical protein